MRVLSAGLVAAGLLALSGCGGSGYNKVTGLVLLDGEPLPEAAVAFVPENPSGELASGYTDQEGRFTMTSTSTAGVKPGKYKVRIEALADKAPPGKGMAQIMAEKYEGGGGGADAKAISKEAGKAFKETVNEGKAAAKKAKRATPKIYNDIDNTPLRADVPATTDYKFELSKDADPPADPKADKKKGGK